MHLSIARVLPDGDVQDVEAAVAGLLPLRLPVSELEVSAQSGSTWSVLLRVSLGGPRS